MEMKDKHLNNVILKVKPAPLAQISVILVTKDISETKKSPANTRTDTMIIMKLLKTVKNAP